MWLINQALLEEIVELSTMLLDNKNMWVSSNAALVIARLEYFVIKSSHLI
jgi:hypothetical protein